MAAQPPPDVGTGTPGPLTQAVLDKLDELGHDGIAEIASGLGGRRRGPRAPRPTAPLELADYQRIPVVDKHLAVYPTPYATAPATVKQMLSNVERTLEELDASVDWTAQEAEQHLEAMQRDPAWASTAVLAEVAKAFSGRTLVRVRQELMEHAGYYSRFHGSEALATLLVRLQERTDDEGVAVPTGGGVPFIFWAALASVVAVDVVLVVPELADLALPGHAHVAQGADALAAGHAVSLRGVRRDGQPPRHGSAERAKAFVLVGGVLPCRLTGNAAAAAATLSIAAFEHGVPDQLVIEPTRGVRDDGGDDSDADANDGGDSPASSGDDNDDNDGDDDEVTGGRRTNLPRYGADHREHLYERVHSPSPVAHRRSRLRCCHCPNVDVAPSRPCLQCSTRSSGASSPTPRRQMSVAAALRP